MHCRRALLPLYHINSSLVLSLNNRQFIARYSRSSLAWAAEEDNRAFDKAKRERYEDTVNATPTHNSCNTQVWDDGTMGPRALAAIRTLSSSLKSGELEEKASELRRGGFRPNIRKFAALVPYIANLNVAAFKDVEKALGVPSTPYIRNALFRNYYSTSRLDGAVC